MTFPHPETGKRYHTLNSHLREKYGGKVFKVMINAGFTCPNIDGTVAYGGCTFCSIKGSGDFAGNPKDDLLKQFHQIRDRMHTKWPEAKYIAYFQAFTNTHAPLHVLKEKYEAVLAADPHIVGLSIATRPDCLPDDVVAYLGELNQRVNLWVELGLQTMHEKTSKLINRAHDYQTFLDGVAKLRAKNINVIVHMINGLPSETDEMMMETAHAVGNLDIQGLKIHLLHVLEKTAMAHMVRKGMMRLLERDEYVDLVVRQLEMINPEIVMHRITGDGPREDLIGPLWSLKKWEILNQIDDTLTERQTYQGRLFRP
ncbi:MAG: TIGR01212 family radical SAM protein [Defluviitaleaceae bacterium]|nr:TIGR01212 family radical SAM protein [Defluviitaleaceae bacterium]